MIRRVLAATVVAVALLAAAVGASYFDAEQITIDATAGGKGFTSSKITPTNGQPVMTLADCRLRTAQISMLWVDPTKTTVTASVGQLLEIGDRIVITSREEILNFRAIRTGATSGQLDCQYKAVN